MSEAKAEEQAKCHKARVFESVDRASEDGPSKVCLPKHYPLGYVYALEYGSHVKIGHTTDPRGRLKSLRGAAHGYSGVTCGRVLISEACNDYAAFERLLHKRFAKKRKNGSELFSVALSTVQKAMRAQPLLDESKKVDLAFVAGLARWTLGLDNPWSSSEELPSVERVLRSRQTPYIDVPHTTPPEGWRAFYTAIPKYHPAGDVAWRRWQEQDPTDQTAWIAETQPALLEAAE